MKLIVLLLVASAQGATLKRDFPPTRVKGGRERVAHRLLLAAQIGKNSRKYEIPFGNKDDPIDTYIDSLPVETRIDAIKRLLSCASRVCLQKMSLHWQQVDPQKGYYMEYLLSSSFLEADAVRIFFRAVYKQPFKEENGIKTIVDLTSYIKTHFQTKHGYSFDGFTPRMLMDWHRIFHSASSLRLEIERSLWYSAAYDGVPIPATSAVCQELLSWRESLSYRIDTLRLTGYENIDL